MTTRTRLAAVVLAIFAAAAIARGEQRIFRGESHGVTVSASVRKGGTQVTGLGVPTSSSTTTACCSIDSVSVEPVPIDVTLFMDTSGSTSKSRRDAERRPADRGDAPARRSLSLLTIGLSVYNSLAWRAPGDPLTLDEPTPGILRSMTPRLALAHAPEPGRAISSSA
jgi:hypothetical protein